MKTIKLSKSGAKKILELTTNAALKTILDGDLTSISADEVIAFRKLARLLINNF